MSVKVKITQFQGSGKLFTRDKDGLAAILRDMLIQTAQQKVFGASVSSITDNTTGAASLGAVPNLPALPINTVTGTAGESASAFNTSLGKIGNATLVFMNTLNKTRQLLGLPLLTYGEGAQASANTLPALDTSGTGAAIASTVDWATAQNAAYVVGQNLIKLTMALNEVIIALGAPKQLDNIRAGAGAPWPFTQLTLVPAAGTSSDGASSVLVTDTTNFLAAAANAFATLAAAYNDYVPAARTVALTDSSGGAAAAALAADALPSPAVGAATTSAPKAGFDTQLATINNAIASLAYAINQLNIDAGGASEYALTDNTGGTVSSTLSSISSSLTAVDGSSGTNAVDEVSALASMAVVANNLSSLGFYASKVAALYDVAPLGTDALGGTVSQTLAAISATAGGVGGGAGAITLLNSAVDTWLAGVKNNISTIAALVNAINTMSATTKPLQVIAG